MTEETLRQLEERVSRLEEEVREVKSQLKKEPEKPWWEATSGIFEGSKTFEAVVREMRKNRKLDYEAAKREGRKNSAIKPRHKAKRIK
jgi:tRNA pseudouridine-54 N-methylase